MESSIGHLISASAASHGEKTALIVNGCRHSFAALDRQSSAIASHLQWLGFGRGSTASICAPNSAEWIIAYYGILKAGCIVNPLNLMSTAPEAAYALTDCGASVLFGLSEKLLSVRSIMGDKSPILVAFDSESSELERFGDWVATSFDSVPKSEAALSEISTIAYTSGTTGKPKGALLTHRAILLNVAMTATMHGRTERDTVVSALPLSHVYGNVVMQCAIAYGMTLVLHATFKADDVLQSIVEHRATIFEGVPTMYLYLLDHPTLAYFDLSSLTRCTVGGQTMPVAKMREVEAKFGARLVELWGMTELGGLGITHPALGETRLGSVGFPFPCVQVAIKSTESEVGFLPAGEVGELVIKGPLNMVGYLNNPGATAETIDSTGYLRTGDLAYMDDDGYVYVVDRLKDMIITGGFNIYPAEIEGVLCEHPSVAMAAVVGVPDTMKGELAKAFIVPLHGCHLSEQDLLDFCRARLASYKIPRLLAIVDDLPKTGSGKILRRALRESSLIESSR